MANLSVGGIGSGLDVKGIVSQLMALERRPLDRLEKNEADLNSKLSAYGKLKSSLSTFQDAMKELSSLSKFKTFSTSSSDDAIFTSTADGTAASGTFSIEVTQLAQAEKVHAGGTYSGEQGDLTFDVNGQSITVTIDATNNTLEGIRNAINSAAGNDLVTATTINSDSGPQLILTGNETGAANTITATGSLAGTLNFQTMLGQGAQDAQVDIDGFTVSSSTNTVTNGITGITLDVSKTNVGAPETLTVTRDLDAVKESVQGFADTYNSLRSTIRDLGKKGGELQGDGGLLSIERQIQSIFNTSAVGLNFNHLSEVGITTGTDGSLSVDTDRLDSALTSDFSGVAELFANNDQGYAYRFEAMAGLVLQTNGLLDTREDTINNNISSIQARQESFEYRLEMIEKRFNTQFGALDSLVASMSATGDFLAGQLANLPGSSR